MTTSKYRRNQKHQAEIICLDNGDLEAKVIGDFIEYQIEDAKFSQNIMVNLRQFLQGDMAKPKHRPNCGGILPELSLEYKGKRFRFTCYMIEENGKTLVKTDYAKFAKYCKGMKEKK